MLFTLGLFKLAVDKADRNAGKPIDYASLAHIYSASIQVATRVNLPHAAFMYFNAKVDKTIHPELSLTYREPEYDDEPEDLPIIPEDIFEEYILLMESELDKAHLSLFKLSEIKRFNFGSFSNFFMVNRIKKNIISFKFKKKVFEIFMCESNGDFVELSEVSEVLFRDFFSYLDENEDFGCYLLLNTLNLLQRIKEVDLPEISLKQKIALCYLISFKCNESRSKATGLLKKIGYKKSYVSLTQDSSENYESKEYKILSALGFDFSISLPKKCEKSLEKFFAFHPNISCKEADSFTLELIPGISESVQEKISERIEKIGLSFSLPYPCIGRSLELYSLAQVEQYKADPLFVN